MRWGLLGTAEAAAIGLAAAREPRTHLAVFLVLFAAASLIAILAARSLSGSGVGFLLLCGGVLRATLLLRGPALSDDVERYAWDARVAAAGISPYAHAPSDPAVARLDPGVAAALPHADVRTVYPPVAQAAFRAARAFPGDGTRGFQVVFGMADLAVVALLRLLPGGAAGFGAALYAFHPLAIVESAGEGHADSLGVALLAAALLHAARGRRGRAGVAFALSVLTKYVAIAAALPLARRGGVRFAAAALATGLAVWLVSIRGGVPPVGGLADYAGRWEFNAAAYSGTVALFEAGGVPEAAKSAFSAVKAGLGHPAFLQTVYGVFYAGFLARASLGLLLIAALLAISVKVRDTETAVFASIGALLLASPTLHPWYLLWVLPWAARRREPAFLYLSFAAPLSYGLLFPTPGLPASAIMAAEYVPFAVLLAITLRRAAVSRRAEAVP